jgi:hypothetical protein
MRPLRLFIGYDPAEILAYHVLCQSILTRTRAPISITPLARRHLSPWFDRPRGRLESTDFAITRFLVPALCGYDGPALFLDCDMLCRADLVELFAYPLAYPEQAVFVVQHDYVPAASSKMAGSSVPQPQTVYRRKNWSSVMLFNTARCRALTPDYVQRAPGLALHQFAWLPDAAIGALPTEWNYLVGEANQASGPPKLVHFTQGGPWHPDYASVDYADAWRAERTILLGEHHHNGGAHETRTDRGPAAGVVPGRESASIGRGV